MYSQYLSDPELLAVVNDAALIRHMLRIEIVLAKVQAELEIIPGEAAGEIEQKLRGFSPEPEALAAGTLRHGIPVIPLLELAKTQLSEPAQDFLHWGATSQDIMDTATVLGIREALAILKERLNEIVNNLRALAEQHLDTYTVARTRTQQATPISFALKVNNWLQPLERHRERLEQLMPRILVVQLGGAGGNLAALDEMGPRTAQALAQRLQLRFRGVWHSQRDSMAELGGWLALLAGTLGKMATDILLMTRSEIGELRERSGGGQSSTMPHKRNPVLSEAVLALSRYVGQMAGNFFQAMAHQQERDGAALAQEWLSLSQMLIATGTMLRHSRLISREMEVDQAAMQANLEKLNGLVFSEQAGFILTPYLGRKRAREVVEAACELVREENIHLADALRKVIPDIDIDWRKKLQPQAYRGATQYLIDGNAPREDAK